jgi:hypothetical protein
MKTTPIIRIALALTLLTALLGSGCVARGWYPYTPVSGGNACADGNPRQLLEHTDLKSLFDGIATEICADACEGAAEPGTAAASVPAKPNERCSGETILVTDFVDLQSLAPQKHGLLMGDLMRSALNSRCGYRIVQAEFSSYFRLSESGLVVLSRNSADIRNREYRQSECVVGTYSFVGTKLIITVRRISTLTGRITRMVTREIDYTCSGDSVSHSVR